MNWKAVVGIVVVLVIGAGAWLVFRTPHDCKIEPPPTTESVDLAKAAGIAAELTNAVKSADVKGQFRSVLNKNYQTLSNRNVELYLYLNAINCFLSKGTPSGDKIAVDLAVLVRAKFANENQIMSLSGPLTEKERNEINAGPSGNEILSLFKKFGIN